ncbi:response regulator transcription factor [Nocardioides sp. ChNu-153]|uniref:helix-turn-helix transcriptional regulator n=1 Tax=unclassified Nocardioides TaxID=2615069 RepID=UPI002406A9A0|nr:MULTISPECIES: response regulator transcription factor [unclassified Nocardioides]MDF9714937.1 response regulator transcription factor [Nocardioides sp. ChNu-99]MDN7122466.1 response regulator transcription factor [Nocardioides sp. ChNu-153]
MSTDPSAAVLLVGDDRMVTWGIRMLVAARPATPLLGTVPLSARPVRAPRGPDGVPLVVVLVEPDVSEVAALAAHFRALAPGARLLAVLRPVDIETCDPTDLDGVHGCVSSGCEQAALASALDAVAAGFPVHDPRLFADRAVAGGQEVGSRVLLLSDQQRAVLALIRDGRSNRDIARRLQLSESTVKNHVTQLLLRLEVGNRIQAAVLAAQAPA